MDETDPKAWLIRQWRRLVRRWPLMRKARARRAVGWLSRRAHSNTLRHRAAVRAERERADANEYRADQADDLTRRQHLVLEAMVKMAGGRERVLWDFMSPAHARSGRDGAGLARALIYEVEAKMGRVAATAYYSRPHCEFARGGSVTTVRCRDIEMVRLGLSVGLPPDTPPELVADQIAAKVRQAVMEQWKHQSVLGVSR